MDPAVRKLIDQPFPHVKTYEEIGALLPADDAELDRWFAELVDAGDSLGFMALGVAAIGANRSVDGRHLSRGAVLVTDVTLLVCFAWHMQGDVPEYLLSATGSGEILPAYSAFALLAIAIICQERRGGAFPPELITRARTVSRQIGPRHQFSKAALFSIAEITRDPAIASILEIDSDFKWKKAEEISATLKSSCTGSPLRLVALEPQRQMGGGFTVRRAVARIGRNDPCPCLSGRKYKNCCMAKDAERLHDSSHIAGKSQADLRAEPEPYLTKERLEKSRAHEIVRYDPRKIAPELFDDFFFVLCAYSLFDRAIECVEILGFGENLDPVCDTIFTLAMRVGRTDAIKKLLAIHPRSKEIGKEMILGARLATAEDDVAHFISVLEQGAVAALNSTCEGELQLYGYSMLCSKLPATSIFIARALIPAVPDDQAQQLLDYIAINRDKLGLSPDDPAGDMLEKRLLEKTRAGEGGHSEESLALADARERLNTKAREVEILRESLETLRRDVKQRESSAKKVPTPSAARASAPTADEGVLQDLRFKVQKLKSELKERHEERVALRQELREAHAKIEVGDPKRSTNSGARDEADPEAKHLLPVEPAETQPIRLPEFPRKFQETLEAMPRHIARNALTAIGRLAAGELAAFTGVVRLKACPDIYRLRIGIDHRLLFRLTPDRVVIVDLISRQDLERRIKTLVAAS